MGWRLPAPFRITFSVDRYTQLVKRSWQPLNAACGACWAGLDQADQFFGHFVSQDSNTQTTRNGRVTIRTVAEHAGVSVAAVSKVMRDAYGVSADMRARVEASIATLNYRPSAAARGMRGKT